MDCKFDHIISLGYNCEVSFRIEDYFDTFDSYLFSWSFELDRNLFIESLRNISNIFGNDIELAEDRMFRCNHYSIKFHPRYEILPKEGPYTSDQYEAALRELEDRIEYLKQKTISVFNSKERKLLVIKVQDFGEDDNIFFIKKLINVLDEVCAEKSYKLVCVFENRAITKNIRQLQGEYVSICGVKRFAPVKHTDILGDTNGWKRIFDDVCGENNSRYSKKVSYRRRKKIPGMVKYKIIKLMRNFLK